MLKDFNDTLGKPANIYNYPSEIIETLPGTISKTNRFGLVSNNGKGWFNCWFFPAIGLSILSEDTKWLE